MLNTLPPPSVPLPPRRRRGGQPSNKNALKHGLYARQHSAPLTRCSISLAHCRLLLTEKNPNTLDRAIQDLEDQKDLLVGLLHSEIDTKDVSPFLALFTVFERTAGFSRRMQILHHQLQQPFHDLQFVAAHAPALILYNFRDYGITRDADSFLKNNEKRYLNSTLSLGELCPPFSAPDFPFLAPRQWDVLEPLLPPSHSSSPPSHSIPKGQMCTYIWEGAGGRTGVGTGVGRPQGRNPPSPFCALQNGEGPGVGPPSFTVNLSPPAPGLWGQYGDRLPSSSGVGTGVGRPQGRNPPLLEKLLLPHPLWGWGGCLHPEGAAGGLERGRGKPPAWG